MTYVKIRSWHIEKFQSRGGMPKTLCGRWALRGAESRQEIPSDEKSCESCLRLAAKA